MKCSCLLVVLALAVSHRARRWLSLLVRADGVRKVVDFPDLPLAEFYARRAGLTLSLTHNW